jgi:hypothetical protein
MDVQAQDLPRAKAEIQEVADTCGLSYNDAAKIIDGLDDQEAVWTGRLSVKAIVAVFHHAIGGVD